MLGWRPFADLQKQLAAKTMSSNVTNIFSTVTSVGLDHRSSKSGTTGNANASSGWGGLAGLGGLRQMTHHTQQNPLYDHPMPQAAGKNIRQYISYKQKKITYPNCLNQKVPK